MGAETSIGNRLFLYYFLQRHSDERIFKFLEDEINGLNVDDWRIIKRVQKATISETVTKGILL